MYLLCCAVLYGHCIAIVIKQIALKPDLRDNLGLHFITGIIITIIAPCPPPPQRGGELQLSMRGRATRDGMHLANIDESMADFAASQSPLCRCCIRQAL